MAAVVSQLKDTYLSAFTLPSDLIRPICLRVDSVPFQVLSGDQELEVLAEASGFAAEGTEQSKEILPN
jgi:hypothetical protein